MKLKNKIKTFNSLLNYKLFHKRSTLSVQYAITNNCNLNCGYCNVKRNKPNDLKTSQILNLIEDLSKFGCKRINFTGGEPLLRKDLDVIVNYCKRKEIITSISSNGYFYNKVKQTNPDFYHFSLDGDEKTHDFLRGTNSYKNLIKSIKIARNNNVNVWTTTVLNKYNLNELDFILNLAEELDFYCHFTPIFDLNNKKIKQFLPKVKIYKNKIRYLVNLRNKRLANSKSALKYMLQWPKFKGNYKCHAGNLHFFIDANGDLYSCRSLRQNKPINIMENGFEYAFNNLYVDKNKCDFCLCQGLVEHNLLFSLDFYSVYNTLRNI